MSRNRPIRHALAAAMFLCAGGLAAHAQDDVIERQLKAAPGRDVRAGVFTDIRPDCTSGPLSAIRLATPPAHGSVTVKRGALRATNKQCLAIEVPAFVAFYRARADYSGADDFELEISSPNGHKRRERVHVTVINRQAPGKVSDVVAALTRSALKFSVG